MVRLTKRRRGIERLKVTNEPWPNVDRNKIKDKFRAKLFHLAILEDYEDYCKLKNIPNRAEHNIRFRIRVHNHVVDYLNAGLWRRTPRYLLKPKSNLAGWPCKTIERQKEEIRQKKLKRIRMIKKILNFLWDLVTFILTLPFVLLIICFLAIYWAKKRSKSDYKRFKRWFRKEGALKIHTKVYHSEVYILNIIPNLKKNWKQFKNTVRKNLNSNIYDGTILLFFFVLRIYNNSIYHTDTISKYIISYNNSGSLLSFLTTLEHTYVCYYLTGILIVVYWSLIICLKDFVSQPKVVNEFREFDSNENADIIAKRSVTTKIKINDDTSNLEDIFENVTVALLFSYIQKKIKYTYLKHIHIYIYYFRYVFIPSIIYIKKFEKKEIVWNNLYDFYSRPFPIIYNYFESNFYDNYLVQDQYNKNIYNVKLFVFLSQTNDNTFTINALSKCSTIGYKKFQERFFKIWKKNNHKKFTIYNSYSVAVLRQRYSNRLLTLQFKHSGLFECVWAIIPTLIIISILIPSLILLYSFEDVLNPYITIKVIGNQWYWSYEFDNWIVYKQDNAYINVNKYLLRIKGDKEKMIYVNYAYDSLIEKDFVNPWLLKRLLDVQYGQRLVLPINATIRFLVSSADVLHAYAVPELGFKIDAVPGRQNQLLIYINRPGVFYGQCSELCGANHGFMPIVIQSLEFNDYLNYINKILKYINNENIFLTKKKEKILDYYEDVYCAYLFWTWRKFKNFYDINPTQDTDKEGRIAQIQRLEEIKHQEEVKRQEEEIKRQDGAILPKKDITELSIPLEKQRELLKPFREIYNRELSNCMTYQDFQRLIYIGRDKQTVVFDFFALDAEHNFIFKDGWKCTDYSSYDPKALEAFFKVYMIRPDTHYISHIEPKFRAFVENTDFFYPPNGYVTRFACDLVGRVFEKYYGVSPEFVTDMYYRKSWAYFDSWTERIPPRPPLILERRENHEKNLTREFFHEKYVTWVFKIKPENKWRIKI